MTHHLITIMAMMNNIKIIGFAGRKRSGKSMLAMGIKENNPNVEVMAIANNLKNLCAELLNVTLKRLNEMKDDGTTFNKKADGHWVSIINQHTEISSEVLCPLLIGKVFTDVRSLLQFVGTDIIRKYKPEWHINKTIEKIKSITEDKIVVIDDVRFPNEKCKIEELGGEVYFVIRPNCFDLSNHVSETSLGYFCFSEDKVIINDLSKDKMINYMQEVLNGRKSPFLLSENSWYVEHHMDDETNDTNFNVNRRKIVKLVLSQNKDKALFNERGVITYSSTDGEALSLFRRIIMNDRRSTDGTHSYSLYNPITNEIIKNYM